MPCEPAISDAARWRPVSPWAPFAVVATAAAQGKRLRVLWLDAHADFNASAITPSGNIHGMPVATLFGFGAGAGRSGIDPAPALTRDELVQIGIRGVDDDENSSINKQARCCSTCVSIDEMGMRTVVRRLRRRRLHILSVSTSISSTRSWHRRLAPPCPAVPPIVEAHLYVEMIADTGRLASADIMRTESGAPTCATTAKLTVDLTGKPVRKST